ncbi:VWA domain-containing protein [Thalassobaculum sp. OXR-137]|uniref:vWA domain-containing protein n=1 Tax=Thalassobaculum sp. OXR-137 TaxID=3100173 RepID=UPI002AC9E7C2|nr:VWA domain-containing protein [Thalassobaculum sp. OXR-137]WPZ34137.1 VWA domain-containing protein [Thalassobaculum sp. OXR-137]
MFTRFFTELRDAKLPVSITEYLTLLRAVRDGVAGGSVDDFYHLSRATLVKDERHLDRFDRVFGHVFQGMEALDELFGAEIPDEWLQKLAELNLSDEEKRQIEAMGGWDKLMETLRQRLEEQKGRHQGGSKWVGTAGTSPYGAYGYNPEGVRIGQDGNRNFRAVKVWDKREFRNLDDSVEIGTRNLKVALRKLRRFARQGRADELDLDGTIRQTAKNGGWLDLQMRAERQNVVNVILFFDVGGSMDPYVKVCEELFSAARSEFKHLEFFYFHNCPYERLWKDNRRRHVERIDTAEVLRTYGPEYKAVFIGDASMSPYEIAVAGGSVEHMNPEAGGMWIRRMTEHFHRSVWLNPVQERFWQYTQSVAMVKELLEDRMYPLSLDGLDRAIKELNS